MNRSAQTSVGSTLLIGLLFALVSSAAVASFSFAQMSCPPLPTDTGSSTVTVNIAEAGDYKIWSRIVAPDAVNNSYWLVVDQHCGVNVGDNSSMQVNTWDWIDYQDGDVTKKSIVNLAAGTHTIKVIGKETGVKVDKILFASDLGCVPDQMGNLCESAPVVTPTVEAPTDTPTPPIAEPTPTDVAATTAPEPTDAPVPTSTPFPTATAAPIPTATPALDTTSPTVSITSPANGATVQKNKVTTIAATATDNVGVSRVVFTITGQGTTTCTDTTAPYTCNWSVPNKSNTTYNVTATAYDLAGNSASSVIQVRAK